MASKIKNLKAKEFINILTGRQARFKAADTDLPVIPDQAMALARALHPKRQYLKVASVVDMSEDTKSFTLVPDASRGTTEH